MNRQWTAAAWFGFALVIAACGRDGQREETARPLAVTEGRITTADGTGLYWRRVGDGPQAVILPGDLFLHPAFDRLAAGRTLYYYDMRNRGQSDSVTAERALTIQQDVLDLEDLRAQLDLHDVDLVGFSYLGLMVAMYAKEHPEHVRRIVQLGPVPIHFGTEYPEGLRAGDYFAAMDSSGLAELRKLQEADYPAQHPREFCDIYNRVTRVALVGNPEHLNRLNANLCDMPNEWPTHLQTHFARHFQSVQDLTLQPADFAALDKPVLTVHGTSDRNAAYGSGREWAMTLPSARLVTVPGGAHCAWADDPGRVFGAIDTFLRGEWPADAEHVTAMTPAGSPPPDE